MHRSEPKTYYILNTHTYGKKKQLTRSRQNGCASGRWRARALVQEKCVCKIYNIHGLALMLISSTRISRTHMNICLERDKHNGARLLMPVFPPLSLCKIITSGVFVPLPQQTMAIGAFAFFFCSVLSYFYRLS